VHKITTTTIDEMNEMKPIPEDSKENEDGNTKPPVIKESGDYEK